ncbi:MAG: cysteine desulfurase family protein [Verrucomicrobia bacterium]|nr:cysteine desulfurase family protein [Verrucomicrobiota bacterium]
MIHLDANASTPLRAEVLEAMLPWLRDGYANPSGTHAAARRAREGIEEARGQVAELLGAMPEELVFTGGGTESVNTALHSLNVHAGVGPALVSAIEHSAVLRYAESLPRGFRVAPVNAGGRLDLDALAEGLPGAAFVSVMAANNETGVLQPLREVCMMARERGLAVHSDAVQAVGKSPIKVRDLAVDMLSLSAHKFHGPKGVGALYVRGGLRFSPLLLGGGQEGGRRSGTENTAGIVGMGAAAAYMRRQLEADGHAAMRNLRDAFENKLVEELAGVTVNGAVAHRLPNTSHLSFEACDAAGLLILLDEAGIACSAGSACMSGRQRPSHVQLAMGIDETRAKSSLRFSFSTLNTMGEAFAAAVMVKRAVEKLRRVQGSGVGPVQVYCV